MQRSAGTTPIDARLRALVQLGCWPRSMTDPLGWTAGNEPPRAVHDDAFLTWALTELDGCAMKAVSPRSVQRAARRLRTLAEAGMRLECVEAAMRSLVVMAAQPLDWSRSVAGVSSRLTRHRAGGPQLGLFLSRVVAAIDPARWLLTAEKATLTEWLEALARRAGRNYIRLVPARPKWVRAIRASLESARGRAPFRRELEHVAAVFDFGAVSAAAPRGELGRSDQREQAGLRRSLDFVQVRLAGEVLAYHLRRGGNVAQALAQRLERTPTPPTRIVAGESVLARRVVEPLLAMGAAAWVIDAGSELPAGDPPPTKVARGAAAAAEIVDWADIDPGAYLTHATRGTRQPWPDESAGKLGMRIVQGTSTLIRGPAETLAHILATQRLFASGHLIRGGFPVVCFTAVPLDQLRQHRVFRTHVARWDFERFGLAIRREVLLRLGARPVAYGPASTYRSVAEADRPFFQCASTRRGAHPVDWQSELEWRILGDVDLRKVPPRDALVLVPDRMGAEMMAPLSRWPILIVGV